MHDLSIFLLCILILIGPGLLLVLLLYSGRSWEEAIIRAPGIGLAGATYIAFCLSYLDIALFWYAWTALALTLAALCWRRRNSFAVFSRPDLYGTLLIILLGLVAVTRFAPTFSDILPQGWDAAFHLLLAKKILLTHRMIVDWMPFEPVSLNYPVGSHILMADLALLTGIPLHIIFKFLVPTFGIITTAQIYWFSIRISGHRELALYASIAYAFLAILGSINYYSWGGLPNLIGMSFFLECLIVVTEKNFSAREICLFGLMFCAIFFTHHHVMITSGAVFACLWVIYQFRPADRERARMIFRGLLAAAVLGSFYMVPFLLKLPTLGGTSALSSGETVIPLALNFGGLGDYFTELTLLGAALYAAQRLLNGKDRFDSLLLFTVASLAGLFVFFEYIYRAIALLCCGKDAAAFTPSRFLTDMAGFLAILAGYSVFFLRRRLPLNTSLTVSLASAAMLYLGWSNLWFWRGLYEQRTSPERFQALQWIGGNLPDNVIVLTDDAFANYISWRRSLNTPIPISEPASRSNWLNSREIVKQLQSGNPSEEARKWIIVSVGDPTTSTQASDILWRSASGKESVYLQSKKPAAGG